MAAAVAVSAAGLTEERATFAAPEDDVAPLEQLAELVESAPDPVGLRGDEALDALEATDTVEVAAANAGMDAGELVEELTTDDSMFVSATGEVGYIEVADPSELTGDDGSTVAALTVPPGTDVDALESLPGVGRVIYLDVNGHDTVDNAWNDGIPINSGPYPGNDDQVYEIWRRVAEDYMPFGVNVTTKDPGVDGLRRTSPTDTAYGQRMVITPDNWYAPGTLGVALVGSFNSTADRSAFVFTGGLSTANIAEAISHEAGHTLGLAHDGIGTQAYYDGHANWAPIMGRPLSKAVTQWSRGEYAGANNKEDDVVKIASYVGYRTDDVGPSPVSIAANAERVGHIGYGDSDVYVVSTAGGPLSATLRPELNPGSNLLANVTVCDARGTVVAVGTPATSASWTAIAHANVPAGRYTVVVKPIGWLTPSNGFSAYGSMGAYRLTMSGAPASSSAPVAPCSATVRPVTPRRLLDTRVGKGGYLRLRGGTQAIVQVAGANGIPAGATAAIVNVTSVGSSGQGFLTVHPCLTAVPNASNVNYVAGQIVANNTIAALSPNGQLCVWTYADTDVLVDVTGWLGPGSGGSKLTAVGPTRVVDTRHGIGGGRLGAGQTRVVDFTGKVPAGTTAVSFNLTAVSASSDGFMTAHPCGQSRPDTSVVNYASGEARPNNVIVGLGGGKVCVYSYAETELIVDLTGHFAPTGQMTYVPTSPRRVLDTRGGVVRPPVTAGTVLQYSAAQGLPPGLDADAAFVNITAVDHPREGFVTTYNCGKVPNASTVNQRPGQANANGAIVPLTSSNASCAWLSDAGHLIADLNGWWVR